MKIKKTVSTILLCAFVSGCAGLEFQADEADDALTYYDPQPYLLVETTADCGTKSSVITLPGRKRSVKLRSGYGSSNIKVDFSNGMISSVNQVVDTKVPETITAASGAIKNIADLGLFSLAAQVGTTCVAQSTLYPIVDGRIDRNGAFSTRSTLRNTGVTR